MLFIFLFDLNKRVNFKYILKTPRRPERLQTYLPCINNNTVVLDNSLLLLAIAPGAFLLLLFYLNDRYDREPILLVFICFLAGAASTILALVLEIALEPVFYALPIATSWIAILAYTTLGVGLPEEFSKLLSVRLVAFKNKAFNEPMDGIVYTVAASMGFATVENIFYVMDLGYGVGILRAVLSVPMHALFAVFLGYYVGRAHRAKAEGRSSGLLLLTGLALATIIHGFFNFILYWFEDPAMLFVVLIGFYVILVFLGVIIVRRALAASPFRKNELSRKRV